MNQTISKTCECGFNECFNNSWLGQYSMWVSVGLVVCILLIIILFMIIFKLLSKEKEPKNNINNK